MLNRLKCQCFDQYKDDESEKEYEVFFSGPTNAI